jgi:hypothetical protein
MYSKRAGAFSGAFFLCAACGQVREGLKNQRFLRSPIARRLGKAVKSGFN